METTETEWDPCADLEAALLIDPFDPHTATVAAAGVRVGIMDALLTSNRMALVALAERLSSMAHVLVDQPHTSITSDQCYHLGRLTALADIAGEAADRVRPAVQDAWLRDRPPLVKILQELSRIGGLVRHSELTTLLDAHASQVTHWLDELEEGDLVVCDRVKNRRYARVSAVGRAFVDALQAFARAGDRLAPTFSKNVTTIADARKKKQTVPKDTFDALRLPGTG